MTTRLDLGSLQRHAEQATVPALMRVLVRPVLRRAGGASVSGSGLRRQLAKLGEQERVGALLALVQEVVAAVLGLAGAVARAVPADQPLKELGLDSLMALEVRTQLSARAEITLPATMVFDYPTANTIAQLLLKRLDFTAAPLGDAEIARMISVSPFERSYSDEVVALWRVLHPDWRWLDNRAKCDESFESNDAFERIGFIVRRGHAVIASVFGTCGRDKNWPRTRRVQIEAQPEDIEAEWLEIVFAGFVDTDRGEPGTWHVTSLNKNLSPVLAPLLEAAGFARHSSVLQIEWSGESVTLSDPSSARLERYAGGNRDIDGAIVDLYNRSHLPLRVVPPIGLADLWKPWLGLELREFVLALKKDRLVGYSDWSVTDGEAWITDYTSTRLGVGAAVGNKAAQILLELGHRQIKALVNSTNEASLLVLQKLGCKVAGELAHTFVRKL